MSFSGKFKPLQSHSEGLVNPFAVYQEVKGTPVAGFDSYLDFARDGNRTSEFHEVADALEILISAIHKKDPKLGQIQSDFIAVVGAQMNKVNETRRALTFGLRDAEYYEPRTIADQLIDTVKSKLGAERELG